MSAGHPHSKPSEAHISELHKLMAQPSFQEMWARPHKVITTYQIPDTAGYSVWGDEYYLDVDYVQRVQSGQIKVEGLTPQQILQHTLTHERVEKCLLDSDNNIDTYLPAHEFATCAEHFGLAQPYKYEKAIAPTIEFNERKQITNIPAKLACAPYLDDPDSEDRRILKQLIALGSEDARKVTKASVEYSRSTSAERCAGCVHMGQERPLSTCEIVCGLVREAHWCKKFSATGTGDDGGESRGDTGAASQVQGKEPRAPAAQSEDLARK